MGVMANGLGDPTFVKLNNGLHFPYVSFGLQVYGDDTAETLTTLALEAGFRNFFASVLAGNQQGFAKAIANYSSIVPRKDIFICGTVNDAGCSGFADCKAQTAASCSQNLVDLGLDYLDMIMLDYPAGSCDSILGQWAAFEDMLKQNLTRSLGVSNFNTADLDCVINSKGTVPALNQMQYSVGHGSDPLVADNGARGVFIQAYSPLNGGGLVSDPDCVDIGKAHNKTSVQVALRWIVQHNATFATSVDTLEHFQQDINIFDFELTPVEMKRLDAKTWAAAKL